MDFDTSMVIDYIIPDSLSDFGAILLWIFCILIVILGICIYLYYQKTPKKIEKQQQKLYTIEQMKKPKEERMQEHVDIRNKVDKIIEINNL
jgi:ATP/ADP translocase